MSHSRRSYGFTIVELMLAMGFVSALLLAIAMTVIQIGNIYNRGMTYKNVNQVGGSIANELQRSISSVKSFDVAVNGPSYIKNNESGRLCTGEYSYVWNYGKYLENPSTAGSNFIKYLGQTIDESPHIYFAKVYDSNNSVCTKVGLLYPDIDKSKSVELINNGQFDLALHGFSIKSETSAMDTITGQQLYSIEFYLGAKTSAIKFDPINGYICSSEKTDVETDLIYCSVNKFNITARAGSATN